MAINYAKTTWVNNQTRLNASNMNNLGNAVTDIIEVLEGKTGNGGLIANFESLRFTVMGDNSTQGNSGLYRRATQLTETLFGGGTTFAYNYGEICNLTFGKITDYGSDSSNAAAENLTISGLLSDNKETADAPYITYGLVHFLSDTSKSLVNVNSLLNTHRHIYKDAEILYKNGTGIQTNDEDKQLKIHGPVISLYSGNGTAADEFAKFTSKETTLSNSLVVKGSTTLESTLNIVGETTSTNIVPLRDNEYYIGKKDNRFIGYFNHANINTADVAKLHISEAAEVKDVDGNAIQGTNPSSVVVYETLEAEINRALAKEQLLSDAISKEISDRTIDVDLEQERAEKAEQNLAEDLAKEIENRIAADEQVETTILSYTYIFDGGVAADADPENASEMIY